MRFLYLDESGDDGAKGSRFYVLVGCAVKESDVPTIQEEVRKLVQDTLQPWERAHAPQLYFKSDFKKEKIPKELEDLVVLKPELRYSSLIARKSPYNMLKDTERKDLADRVFKIIVRDNRLKLFGVVIDKPEHERKYTFPKPVDLFAIEMLMERFQVYLEVERDTGILIYDQKDQHNNVVFRNFVDVRRAKGTAFCKLPRIIENLLFLPSELCELIQLADFCSHAVFLKYEKGKDQRFQQIRKNFFSLKTFP